MTLDPLSNSETVLNNERGVHHIDTPGFIEKLDQVALDDVAFFKKIVQEKSIRRGAVKLGLSINTLRNKIKKIEDVLGNEIVIRGRTGLTLTPVGEALIAFGKDLVSVQAKHRLTPKGRKSALPQLTLSVTEGVGTFWVLPRLHTLTTQIPDTKITLNCFSEPSDDWTDDDHIRISFKRPQDMEKIAFRLATIHAQLWASKSYIHNFGRLSSMDDLSKHRYVHQETRGLYFDTAKHFLPSQDFNKILQYNVNSSAALFWSVSNGLGMGILPSFANYVHPELVPITVSPRLQFDLWLSYDPALKNINALRSTILWLREIFDEKTYPCFSSYYHPPKSSFDMSEEAAV